MNCFWFLFFLHFCLINSSERLSRVRRIVGGEPAVAPPEDDPVVFIRFADKSARILGVRDFPHYVFRGLRYGHPPTGKDRFLRPRQYFLQGFENATTFPPACVQPVPGENRVIGDEDCLFLNVFTPTLPTGMEGLPVIVWIHGGGFRYGSASQYGVRHLVGKQVVVVTIQYRLGSLGFLSTGTKTLPGNAGLWDMVLAVQWTRNYIGFFGGNPHRITVMGHGTGASSSIMIALSNVAKGLTSGIVAMSGSSVSRFATDDSPKNTAIDVAEANGCPIGSELTMVRCLQNLQAADVIKMDSFIEKSRLRQQGFISGLAGRLGAAPVFEGRRDGRSLPPVVEMQPLNDPDCAKSKIPLLTGITKDETKRACHNQYKNEILNNLQRVPDFVDKVFVKNLQDSLGLQQSSTSSGHLLNLLNPGQFKNYLSFQKGSIREGLAKISEATCDALFNVPAFLTADAWAKQDAPSFLYRFEHVGKKRKGFHFLKGLPLTGNSSQSEDSGDTVAHGDELAYVFDLQDFEGNLLDSGDSDEEDNKVRDVFTEMIANFARWGKATVEGRDVKPFSITDNNFIQINPQPKISNGFRYCEMGLWLGLAQRLQSNTCKLFNVLDSQLGNLPGILNSGGLGTGNVGDTLGLGAGRKPAGALSGSKSKQILPGLGIGR